MTSKAIVLDANILIRAVLGKRVRELILENAGTVKFFAPTVAFDDAKKYLPALLEKRGASGVVALAVLTSLESMVQSVDEETYSDMRQQAMQRISARDVDDWPILACAMALGCPVWTEDADFFGTGVPIWTTDRVSLYFT